MSNEYYDWYKDHHICVGCYKRTAARGKTRCPDCLFADAERSRKKRAAMSAQERQESNRRASQCKAALYARRKAENLCVQCGQRAPLGKNVRCGICKDKARRQADKHRQKIGQRTHSERCEHDVCYNCYGVPLPGKRLCAECSDRAKQNLSVANQKIEWHCHPWR